MKNIALIYGGNSYEKEISIITAIQALKNIDKKIYKVIPIYYDKEFKIVENAEDFHSYRNEIKHKKVMIHNGYLHKLTKTKSKRWLKIDCALLCLHGGDGEDGSMQAFLKINKIPYTSTDMKASSIGMNKDLTKQYLNRKKIRNLKYIKIRRGDTQKEIDFPAIIKPNSLGSSIGVSVVENLDQFKKALEIALKLDDEVIIEKALTNYREFNIACFKTKGEIVVSSIEEVCTKEKYLTFENKYVEQNTSRKIPAEIDESLKDQIEKISKLIYGDLDMKGVVRFDYLYQDKKLYVNEFNTIPGSLAFYLFSQYRFKELISLIIEESIENKKDVDIQFNSGILEHYKDCKKLKISK